jgi:hypothetical protein
MLVLTLAVTGLICPLHRSSVFLNVSPFVPRIVSVGPVLGPLIDPLGGLTNPLVAGINPYTIPTVVRY